MAARPWTGAAMLLPFLALLVMPDDALGQDPSANVIVDDPEWAGDPPDLSRIVDFARTESELRLALERYGQDRAAIQRRYPVEYSPLRTGRLREFYEGWRDRLPELDFDALSQEGRIDYILLRNQIRFHLAMLDLEEERWDEIVWLVPFSDPLRDLQETRHDRQRVDPRETAQTMNDAAAEAERLTRELKEGVHAADDGADDRPWEALTPGIASRAENYVHHLRETVSDFDQFYQGYDPEYTWWTEKPKERLDTALEEYAEAIRYHLVGIQPDEPAPIVGDPVMAEGLEAYLAVEMIPYTAEELIEMGWQEFEWIENELERVSADMGFDDWQDALEHTKQQAPPPGEKPWRIFDIAEYSENFLEGMNGLTVPPLASEVWRLAMQTPERQLVNPFFTGGEVTRVSYPHIVMEHDDKLMSMRGNTPHFNFATVHHELIPGHHLQGFMSNRFNSHRGQLMRTPFWGEGWALYWELLLYDNDFPRSNEDAIGMLFWRLHRAARIVFSMNFQLGEWSAQEAIDFLVDRVGHEQANAEAEVRRSARATPLYQIAYLVGGLQFYSLYDELVENGDMTAQEYHDAVLQGGRMPVEMVRARLTGEPLTRDYETNWRFYDFEGDR